MTVPWDENGVATGDLMRYPRNTANCQMDTMTAQAAPSTYRSVLLVDDDLGLLDALEGAFKEAGDLKIVALAKFEDAKRILRTEPFDVLVTDVRLGAFNGLQLASLARDFNPAINLIVFSGFDDPVLRQEAKRLGGVYLIKPVMSSHLLQLIHREGQAVADGPSPSN